MSFDAPWFHTIATPHMAGNGTYNFGKALCSISENDSITLKNMIEDGLDCDKKIRVRGSEQPLVLIAAERNRYDCVKVLCENGCNLWCQTDTHESPLMLAVNNQNLDMVKLMVKYNVNLNESSYYTGRTPLGYAVTNRKLEIVKTLVDAGADMTKRDASGKTILSLACDNKYSNPEIIQYLLEKGCDPFAMDFEESNGTCIQKLLFSTSNYNTNHVCTIEKMIQKMSEISLVKTKEFMNFSTISGHLDHPIGIMASKWNDTKEEIEIMKLLINGGSNPLLAIESFRHVEYGKMSLIEFACTNNHINLVKLLMGLGITQITIESPVDLLTKTLQKGHFDIFYCVTRSSQKALEIIHMLRSDGIDEKIWEKVIEFRKKPLSLMELSRISILGKQISYQMYQLPPNLPAYLRLEEVLGDQT